MAEEETEQAGQQVQEPAEEPKEPETGKPEEAPKAKYTDEDVDGIVAKRLARERSKLERELREKLAGEQRDERTEAEKLATMTELQRAQYEARKAKDEIAQLRREKDLSEQMAVARKELAENGCQMPDELLSRFVSPKADETAAAVEAIKKLWPEAVNKAVQEQLKRPAPVADGAKPAPSEGAMYAKRWTEQHQPRK